MPELLAEWRFGSGRMTTTSGSELLRELLLRPEDGAPESFGTHSAKSTVLSWAAKCGIGKGTRRLLGGHAAQKDFSMLEYSRDALAEPLREVQRMFARIRAKTFLPDATRSGYMAPDLADSSSSDTSSEEQGLLEEQADVAEAALASVPAPLPADPLPVEGLVGNKATKVLHRAGETWGETACGHVLTVERFCALDAWPATGWTRCRKGVCFPLNIEKYDTLDTKR